MRKWTRVALPVLAAAVVVAVSVAGTGVASAQSGRFPTFTPLTASAGPTSDESQPITFGNDSIRQRSVADRTTQLANGAPNSGSWDMVTVNETGPGKGSFLFNVFETGQGGVQRHNIAAGTTETIWMSPQAGDHVSFDPSYWTPWGT